MLSRVNISGLKSPKKVRLHLKSWREHWLRHPSLPCVEVLATWPVSECVRDLQSFISLFSHYCLFVRRLAEIAASFHVSTGKYAQFEWYRERQVALEKLKGTPTISPILVMPLIESDTHWTRMRARALVTSSTSSEQGGKNYRLC